MKFALITATGVIRSLSLFWLSAVLGPLLIIIFASRFNTPDSPTLTIVLQGAGVASSVRKSVVVGLCVATVIVGQGFPSVMQLLTKLARQVASGLVATTLALLPQGMGEVSIPARWYRQRA